MVHARFLGTAEINGRPVSFFSPPHDEPDFVWVDVMELARAFLSDEDALWVLRQTRQFGEDTQPAVTARNGDRIVSIVSHPFAQGLCGFIDVKNGHPVDRDAWSGGPAGVAYCLASVDAQERFAPLDFSQIAAAFKNAGGPSLRGLRDDDGGTAG